MTSEHHESTARETSALCSIRAQFARALCCAAALLLLSLAFLPGCDRSPGKHLEEVTKELEQTLDEMKQMVPDVSPGAIGDGASGEVEKLFTFEYKVHEMSAQSSAAEIEATLQKLGAERWDCFSVQEEFGTLRLICKRLPKTYLRYIPRVFP